MNSGLTWLFQVTRVKGRRGSIEVMTSKKGTGHDLCELKD